MKSRRMRWVGHVAHKVNRKGAYRVLVERPLGNRQPVRSRRRWEDNIKMGTKEMEWNDMDWIDLA
jgi:hypothetical protein